jgi:hypothetical protein
MHHLRNATVARTTPFPRGPITEQQVRDALALYHRLPQDVASGEAVIRRAATTAYVNGFEDCKQCFGLSASIPAGGMRDPGDCMIGVDRSPAAGAVVPSLQGGLIEEVLALLRAYPDQPVRDLLPAVAVYVLPGEIMTESRRDPQLSSPEAFEAAYVEAI